MRLFNNFFYCLLLSACHNSMAQEVIATAGMYGTNSTGSLSITLGEVITETGINGSGILTQGFQQNYESILSLSEMSENAIQVYPNPFSTHFFVEGDFGNNSTIFIYDVSFRLIEKISLNNCNSCQINLSDNACAEYFIYLSLPDQLPRFIGKLIHTIP
jgi:hypothetical protein